MAHSAKLDLAGSIEDSSDTLDGALLQMKPLTKFGVDPRGFCVVGQKVGKVSILASWISDIDTPTLAEEGAHPRLVPRRLSSSTEDWASGILTRGVGLEGMSGIR